IEFYRRALGARILARYEHGLERHVSHSDLALGDARFSVTEEAKAWNSIAPSSLGGSPVVLQWGVADADDALQRFVRAGGTVIHPLQPLLGERMARLADPFGHVWLLRQKVQDLTVAESQRQRDELFERFTRTQPPEEPARHPAVGLETEVRLSHDPVSCQAGISPRDGLYERSPRVHLVVGPVGAGKSTLALQLARQHRALRLTLDAWMTTLFSRDRPERALIPWYIERAERCTQQIWSVAQAALEIGTDVVLEIGLIQREPRLRFWDRLTESGADVVMYVVEADREVRRRRVEARNRERGATFSMLVPPDVFELASDLWEAPDASECADRQVVFLRTDPAP
ncbi:MAG TPA: AAA family ATPase, partial [Polyangiaceae bacterium]|nr:AAA family ATPase [Polyangiaceae bacterium]